MPSTLDQNSAPKIRVAVIYGGRSTEHSVSCMSAAAVMEHLDPERYEIIPVGITRDGVWTTGTRDYSSLKAAGGTLPEVLFDEEITLSLNPSKHQLRRVDSGEVYAEFDVVFPVLHGTFGEDGTIQGLFEIAGVPYVGPGVLASAAGMDKEFTKKLLAARGLPITDEVVLSSGDCLSEEERQRLGLPVFVKPARGGSSVGISKVNRSEDLDAAIETARKYDDKVIVEAMVHGSEVEVGVLEYPDGRIVASVPAQLNGTEDSEEGFYGFETKYIDDVVTATIPAPFEPVIIDQLQAMAIDTFRALDCKGLARVDFFVTEQGPVLNEINTLPGFTPISMYPQVFLNTGISYPELLDTLIATAMA